MRACVAVCLKPEISEDASIIARSKERKARAADGQLLWKNFFAEHRINTFPLARAFVLLSAKTMRMVDSLLFVEGAFRIMPEADSVIYGETFEVRFLWGRRRLYPRYPLKAPVEFTVVLDEAAQTQQARGEGNDISLGGVGVTLPQTETNVPPVGARIRLQLEVEGTSEPLVIEGVVVHSDAQRSFGISFEVLTSTLRKRLKVLLARKVEH